MFIIECDSSVILNAIVFLFKDPEMRGRRRYFKKPRGKEMLMAVSFSRPQPGLPPRLQPGPGNNYPVRSPGIHGPAPPPAGLAYEHYRPHHPPRPPRGYAPPRLDTKSFTDAYSLFYLLNMSYPYSSDESVFVGCFFCFCFLFHRVAFGQKFDPIPEQAPSYWTRPSLLSQQALLPEFW